MRYIQQQHMQKKERRSWKGARAPNKLKGMMMNRYNLYRVLFIYSRQGNLSVAFGQMQCCKKACRTKPVQEFVDPGYRVCIKL